jgi:hypothetical protein
MLRGVDGKKLPGVNKIRHAYGTATPIERLRNSIPQLPQSATEPIVCHALHTTYSIALYRYCNYKHYVDSTTSWRMKTI